jgi:monofunctional biosynthetic peptidoglycan transglycosylase
VRSRLVQWLRQHPVRAFFILLGIFIAAEATTIPFFSVSRLNRENPKETALMRQRIHEAENEGRELRIKQKWISLSHIPKFVIDAVIVAEDGTFYTHGGIDWFEVQESIERNLDEGRAARGASTITQQLAKNLYLSTSKDPVRKLKEVLITFLLEKDLTKARILELYLNLIEWGRGVFGIEAASQAYFGKSVSSLTLDEAARLAAVIPSPLRHRPDVNSGYVMYLKRIVLARLSARNPDYQLSEQENTPSPPMELYPRTEDAGQASDSTTISDTTEVSEENNNGL